MVTNRLPPRVEEPHGARHSQLGRTANACEDAYPVIRFQHLREASSPSLRNRSLITSVQVGIPPRGSAAAIDGSLFQLSSSSSFIFVLLTATVTLSCCRGRTLRLSPLNPARRPRRTQAVGCFHSRDFLYAFIQPKPKQNIIVMSNFIIR